MEVEEFLNKLFGMDYKPLVLEDNIMIDVGWINMVELQKRFDRIIDEIRNT